MLLRNIFIFQLFCLFPVHILFADTLDQELRDLIHKYQLSGKPLIKKTISSINSPLAQLGKRLFFSMELGGQRDTACASCHHPLLGGGDKLSLSIGVNAVDPKVIGPGRKHSPKGFDFDGGPTVPRNAQTTFNTIFYNHCMFWDCRVESLGATPGLNGSDGSIMRTPDTMWGMPASPANSLLQAQAGFPVTAEDEMRARFLEDEHGDVLRNALTKRILDDEKHWLPAFRMAFKQKGSANELIRFENITAAIAAYEESQVFINSPWKHYVEGDNHAINSQAKQGALLFLKERSQGGYACSRCHRGDFLSDENFYVMAIPQIGRGTNDGAKQDHDYGRYLMTGNEEDKFAFRTPSLLNVEMTGPYGHNGAYEDLKDMIRHMIAPVTSAENYQYSLHQFNPEDQNSDIKQNTAEVVARLRELIKNGKTTVVNDDIDEGKVDQLNAFLLTLTDPCTKEPQCLAPWIQ